MSTTVTYKGETLTTVNNATKTLETKGTWLEDDIELTDVSGGGSTLGTKSITNNGTYNASSDSLDGYSQVTVSVPASAVDSGTKSITANGNNQDVVGYAAVNVNVPNTYSAGDEGKVVSNGALVAQTSDTVTQNGTVDTTLINSLLVNVSGGGGGEDGTFIAAGATGNVTISVSALYSHFLVWDAGITQDDDISSAPYGTRKLILAYADNNTGFIFRGIINSSGTGFTGEFSGIGRWGGNTAWTNRAEFTSSTIKLISLNVGGASVQWIDGRTINWRAW